MTLEKANLFIAQLHALVLPKLLPYLVLAPVIRLVFALVLVPILILALSLAQALVLVQVELRSRSGQAQARIVDLS